MKNIFWSCLLMIGISATVVGQEPPPVVKKDTPPAKTEVTVVKAEKANKVENLTLPADQEVSPDEGFVVVKAECKGSVKWLVISSKDKNGKEKPVKYITDDQANTLIVSVPQSGFVTIFAVGLCDNKLTDYAKTVISVKEPKENPATKEATTKEPIKW